MSERIIKLLQTNPLTDIWLWIYVKITNLVCKISQFCVRLSYCEGYDCCIQCCITWLWFLVYSIINSTHPYRSHYSKPVQSCCCRIIMRSSHYTVLIKYQLSEISWCISETSYCFKDTLVCFRDISVCFRIIMVCFRYIMVCYRDNLCVSKISWYVSEMTRYVSMLSLEISWCVSEMSRCISDDLWYVSDICWCASEISWCVS